MNSALSELDSKMDFSSIHIDKEYPLYYPTAPATLREFASTRLAIDLWRHFYKSGCTFTDLSKGQENICHNYTKQVFKVTLTPEIKEIIDRRINLVGAEVHDLVEHFIRYDILNRNVMNTVGLNLDTIVYGPDATIRDEANAKSLLSSDKFTPAEKYKIAIAYCFEKEVRKIWPLVCNQQFEPLVGLLQNNHRLIIQYWDNEMRNSFHDIEYHRGDVDWSNWKIWTAFEYILNKIIPFDERFTFIEKVLQKNDFKDVEFLLPKLNEAQANWILERYPDRIIVQLASLERYLDYMMKIWTRVKESITEEHFSHIIRTLCRKSYQCYSLHIKRKYGLYFGEVTEAFIDRGSRLRNFLSEIWISAPFRLRSSFASNRAVEIFVELKSFDEKIKTVSCYDYGMQFFSQLLADMSADSRDKIWRDYWLVFFTRSRPKNLINFLKLCLKEEDIEQFGENELMNFEKVWPYIEFLLKKGCLDDVTEYATFFPIDRPFARKFREQIFESDSFLSMLFYSCLKEVYSTLENFVKMAEFIDRCSVTAEDAKIIKSNALARASSNAVFLMMLRNDQLDDVIRACELFSSSEQDLINVKNTVYKPYEIYVLSKAHFGEFCLPRWTAFSAWCDPEKLNLHEFKNSFPVDEFFKKKLHEAIEMLTVWLGPLELQRSEPEPAPSSVRKLQEFDVIDDFLTWYSGSETDGRNYKRNVILIFPDLWDLGKVLNAKNECIVNDVLRWGFNGDAVEISNFKERLRFFEELQ